MTQFVKVHALTYKVTNVTNATQDFIDNLPDSDQWVESNTASIGYTYKPDTGVFTPPRPYSSWTLDEATNSWQAPLTRPNGAYYWDEDAYQADNTSGWVAVVMEDE